MHRGSSGVNQLALALIAAGVLWLMLQLGFVPDSLWASLARWWPLLLVAAGAGLVFPRVGLAPALLTGSALILAFSLLDYRPASPMATGSVSEALPAGARSASFDLELGSFPARIVTSPDASLLFAGDFTGPLSGVVEVDGGERPEVNLRPQRTVFNPLTQAGEWRLTLPATLPISLELETGSARADVDLSRALLRELEVDGGSGWLSLALPATSFTGEVAAGSGRLELAVPGGASVDLSLRLGSGASTLTVGGGADANIEVHARSGRFELVLPPSAPIRLTIDRDGSGSVSVSDRLTRRSGRGDVGVWESSSLAGGGRVIDVRVASVGSGAIVVR